MSVYLACSSAGDDDTHGPVEWRVFVFAEGGIVGRLFGRISPDEIVAEVFGRLRAVLAGAVGITNLREE